MKRLRSEWCNSSLPIHMLDKLNNILDFETKVNVNIEEANTNLEEYEIKFRYNSEFARNLKNIGFNYGGYSIEKSFIYDDQDMSLHQVDARLRVRTFQDAQKKNSSSLITVKKPKPRDSIGAREFEAEILVRDRIPEDIINSFTENNLKVISSYERIRHYITLKGYNVKVDIDLLPDIGRYVEIEGQEDEVLKVALILKIDLNNLIYDPYDTLHADWCLSQNRPEEDFVTFNLSDDKIIAKEARFIEELKS